MENMTAFDRFFKELDSEGTPNQKRHQLAKAIQKTRCPYLAEKLKDFQKQSVR